MKTFNKILKTASFVGLFVLSFLVVAGSKTDCQKSFSKADKALLKATKNRDLSGFISAMQQGADINVGDKKGYTALIHASKEGRLDVIKQLIYRTDADPNVQDHKGQTALIHATKQGYKDVISFLLDNGADPTIQDNKGRTARSYMKSGKKKYENREPDYYEESDFFESIGGSVGRIIDSILPW